MPSTLDVINEVRKKYGQLPIQNTGGLYNVDGYTNNNDLGTLAGAFGIGTANMANNTLVGGTGYGLGNLGRFVEWLSPFSGETITPNDRRALANIGYNAEQINQLAPYEDSWITSGAKGVLSAHNAIEDSLNDWRAELLGDNPTTLAKMAEGSGSSIGYMLAALALGTTPLGSSLIAGAGEALSEAGGFMGDAYRNGQYDNGALSAANKGFAANAVLNTGLNYLLSPFGKIAGKIENPVARYLVGTGTETLNELLQEPSQQVIEQAATNSLNNGTGFMSELGESVKQLPEIFPQLAPEVAGSTLMTQALLAPMGIKANYAYNQGLENVKGRVNAIDERLANIPQNEETQKLIEDRNAVFNTINKLGYNNNWKGLNQSLIHLNNLENAINNYGKSSEEIQAEKQAETIAQDTATQQPTMEASPLSPIVQPEQTQRAPLPDEILQPLLDKYRRIQSLIDDKLQIPNTSNINKEQEELTDLFTKLNRIDNAINNGDIIEANSILSEEQSKNEPITIETANINQLKAEHDRLQELYESKLEEQNHHNSPQLQEELKSLLDNLDTVDNAIKERERQANIDLLSPMPLENSDTQQNNIPSMDDLWSMVEQNQDNNHYDNDYDYGENSDYDNYDYDKEDNNISSNIEAEEQNNHSETTSEEQLRQDFKQQAMNVGRSEDEAEAESHLFIAMNKSLAKYAGLSLEKYIKADNLSIVYTPKIDDGKGHNVQARTEFIPERRNMFGDIEQEAQTIIRVSQMANQSSIIHEMGHIFLRKLQRLAQSGQLKGLAKQDWDTLRKNYGISKLDFNNMSDADLRAWTDIHEKFATDFERYMMTGEAPSSKMKHIFEQFKRWLTDIYHSIQNIKYVGSDGQEHAFELSPEMKEVFDHLLGEHEENENYKQTLHNLDADNDFITPEQIEHFNQLAFHGTGHIIENNEFKLSKVASGEGTQYQGYGIYLAENRAVPEHYRGFGLPNGGRGIMYVTMNDGTIYGSPDERKWNNLEASEFREALEGVRQYAIYQPNLSMKEVLDDAKKNISEYLEEAKNSSQNTPERIKTLKAVVQKFLSINNVEFLNPYDDEKKGNIYKVEGIPEDFELLDWDAPIDKQPIKVSKAINAIKKQLQKWGIAGNFEKNMLKIAEGEEITGRVIYRALQKTLEPLLKNGSIKSKRHGEIKRADQFASMLFNNYGISGNRYFDKFSRIKGEGTHNFVVWNTKLLKIMGLTEDSDEEAKEYFERTKTRKKQKNSDVETYNQIIGEQGAKRLDKQEGVTTRMDYLSIAKGMEEADKETKVIRYATGWERGKDGKWRYEIMDSDIDDAKIYENMEQNDIPFTMKLSDVYKNEELLTAYPSLKDIDVKFTDKLKNGTKGQFEGKKIKLSTDYSINSIRSTLIHEIQHAIQDIEGFANGGNPEQFIPETDAPRKRFQKELDSLDKRSGIEKLRQGLQEKVIKGKIKLEDAEKEIEKARKNSPYDNLYAKLQDEVMQHEEWLKKKYKGNTKPYDIYRSLAGEVEARNAQARMDLTKKERKNTLLSDTEDVDRNRQIETYNQSMAADEDNSNTQEQIDAVRRQYEGTDKWLKAPNGKKSNLTEKQWLQVRTPNFKRWFGNWEAPIIKERLTNGDMVSIQDNGNELIKGQESIWHDLVAAYSKNQQGAPKQLLEFLRPLIPETITNVNIGDIGFTNNSLRNSLHHKNGKANVTVLPYIKEILESAEYIGSRNIEAKRTSYILAKPLLYDGQRFIMLMVVNEDTQGKKYYDHEFTTIKKIDGLPTVLRKSKTTEGGQNHQSLLSILAEDVWFNNASKVVDENGEPLVVYHGTNENFSIFEHDKIGESSGDYGYSGYGFYFTPNEGEAWMYGTIKMPVFLNIKNPFRCDFADLEKYSNILSFDENDKNNIIDKEKLISALESKSPVAKDFFQELEKNGYEKACENIMQKYSDEEIKQSPIDFNNVVEYWEYAQGKIEVPYYVAEDIIAELGEDIIKREYVETPHLKELLNYGKDKSQTQEFIKALKQDGYDGVIYGDEHVIFNSEQAKSATDNTGTFNSNNPDIYYQAFSPRKSLIQRLKDWIKGKGIEERERLFSSADATNNTDYSFDNEESERRWEEAKKGIQQPTAPQRIKRTTLNLLRSFRGDYPELAGNKEFNFAREAFRKLGRAKSTQVHKSMKTFTENLGKLSKRQLDLFARKRLLDDLMWRKQQVPDAELPFGFTDESLKKEYEKFTKIAESDKAVMKAIHDEEQTMQAISKEFADLAGKLGLNLDKVFKNPHYFRHSILEYANAAAVGTKNGKSSQNTEITNNGSLQNAINSKLNDIRNRSFLKKYKGSNLDINMNYAQAMGEVRAQMLMDIETMKTLLEIKEHYDKAPELREALKKAFTPLKGKNESHNQGDGVKLSEIIPEGYTLYNPAGSRLIQSANTTAENVLAMAIDDASEESGLPLDEIINSMGTTGEEFFNQLWIIPKEIKETLRKMSKGRDRGLLGNTARVITRGWKKLVLFSPTRNLKYNFRNFTGDLDAVIAGNPSALKFFGQSVKELTAYFTGKEITQDLKDYMERSGGMEIESMSFSDNEVKELQSLAEILKDKSSSIPKKGWNLIKKFFANEVAFTQWREHLLRYAAYLAYKQDMDANNGIPSTWGASIKDEVMSLDNVMTRSLNDNRDKAYKMSNELLGAYDQVSDTGKQLRETLIPFYSWMEVNMRRYYRLLKNGFSGQNSSDFTKRLLLGQTAIVPFYALSIAETTAKIAALTLAVQMFNRMFFGDDDDKLPNDVKYRPHLTLGEIGGKVYYFDRIGALADATDWLSLDSIFLDAKELVNGQQSIGGYLKKIAQAPVNKIINGLNPILKMPIELATGRTMYPDAFNSRTIRDNEKYIAQSLGLAWPYKALVTGEPRNDWDELSRMLIYSLDPDEAAYFQTLDKVRQFQERVLDKKFDGFATTRRGKVLQNLKRALRYKDKAAIRRYLKEYAKVDGTKKGLQQSMKAMSPLFGLSKDEKKQFLKWITADDRKYLRRADKYFRELTSRFLR